MIPSLEGLRTKAKEAPSPHEVRLSLLDTNPVFHSLTNPVFHSHAVTFHQSHLRLGRLMSLNRFLEGWSSEPDQVPQS